MTPLVLVAQMFSSKPKLVCTFEHSVNCFPSTLNGKIQFWLGFGEFLAVLHFIDFIVAGIRKIIKI